MTALPTTFTTLEQIFDGFKALVTNMIAAGGDVVDFIVDTPLAMLGVFAWLAVLATGFVVRLIKN